MPTTGLRQELDLFTRNQYTKVKMEIGIKVDGKELPSMTVLGGALEDAIELIQQRVKESYQAVPPRVDTPMADPYKYPSKTS